MTAKPRGEGRAEPEAERFGDTGIGARPAPPTRQIRHKRALTAKLAPERRQLPRDVGRWRVAVNTRARGGAATMHIEREMWVSAFVTVESARRKCVFKGTRTQRY